MRGKETTLDRNKRLAESRQYVENRALPEPDDRGNYQYPDGSRIWWSEPSQGWLASWAPSPNPVVLTGHDEDGYESDYYFDRPEDAAAALHESGQGPASMDLSAKRDDHRTEARK